MTGLYAGWDDLVPGAGDQAAKRRKFLLSMFAQSWGAQWPDGRRVAHGDSLPYFQQALNTVRHEVVPKPEGRRPSSFGATSRFATGGGPKNSM